MHTSPKDPTQSMQTTNRSWHRQQISAVKIELEKWNQVYMFVFCLSALSQFPHLSYISHVHTYPSFLCVDVRISKRTWFMDVPRERERKKHLDGTPWIARGPIYRLAQKWKESNTLHPYFHPNSSHFWRARFSSPHVQTTKHTLLPYHRRKYYEVLSPLTYIRFFQSYDT